MWRDTEGGKNQYFAITGQSQWNLQFTPFKAVWAVCFVFKTIVALMVLSRVVRSRSIPLQPRHAQGLSGQQGTGRQLEFLHFLSLSVQVSRGKTSPVLVFGFDQGTTSVVPHTDQKDSGFRLCCGKTRTKYQVRKQFLPSSCATGPRKDRRGFTGCGKTKFFE